MSQVTEQSVRFQTALASIKLIQASAVLDLTEDDFDFLTSNKRSEERFSRNAETDLVCRLLLEKKKLISCASPASYSGLSDRTHTFDTRASDHDGTLDTSHTSCT